MTKQESKKLVEEKKEQAEQGEKSNQDKYLTKGKMNANDFIELEFTGKTSTGEIFDTNIKEQAEKINSNLQPKQLVICLGQAMILPAIDDFLIGKSLGKYILELKPEQAFGNRNPSLVKTMPLSVFQKQENYPQPGMVFQFDNMLARVSAVSGGRVIADFNNPLAGKPVVYELNAKKKIEDINEKIKSLISFFFRQEFEYKLEDKKLIIKTQPGFEKFINMFKPKFKEILSLDLEVEVELREIKKANEEVVEEDEETETEEEVEQEKINAEPSVKAV